MSFKKTVCALDFPSRLSGCFLRGGALTPAYGTEPVGACPQHTTFAAYSYAAGQYFYCTDGELYVSDDGTRYSKLADTDGFAPFVIEYIDGGAVKVAVVTGDRAAIYAEGAFTTQKLPHALDCGAVHCGRLFGGMRFTVMWSGSGGLLDWKEGISKSGSVTLDPERGEILGIKVFAGKLVVVRQFGLTVLSMYGSPENFSVDITDTSCDAVLKNTAQVVGDRLIFCTRSGLKAFDGVRITPFAIRHPVTEPTCSATHAGRYFVVCGEGIVSADADGESCLTDERPGALFVKDGVFACNGGTVKRLTEGEGVYKFVTTAIDFGTARFKTLTAIELDGVADLLVGNGRESRVFEGASGIVRPRLRGKAFTVTVKSGKRIGRLDMTAEVTRGI